MGSFSPRTLWAALFFLAAAAGNLWGRGTAIDSVSIGRYGAADFTRLSEYFCGHRAKFHCGIYRSDWSSEGGVYAVAFLNRALCTLPDNLNVTFEFLVAGDPAIRKIGGAVGGGRNSRELWIGITDEKWAKLSSGDVLAWRISLDDGREELCVYESFLFPGGKSAAKNLAMRKRRGSK
jgi:hypothetical protein